MKSGTFIKQSWLVLSLVLVAVIGMAVDDAVASSPMGDLTGQPQQSRLELPAETLVKVYRYYQFEGVTQSEAEALFGSAEAAIYEPELNRVRMISLDQLQTARRLLSKSTDGQSGALPGDADLEKKIVQTGSISLRSFLSGLPNADEAKAGSIQGQYLVKTPAVGAPLPADAEPPRRIDPTKSGKSYSYIYEDFEGDTWAFWSRWDNNGGQYQWGVRSCDSYSGSYSGNASRGGSLGASLGCNDAYPRNTEMRMYFEVCEAIAPSWEVTLEMKFQASIEDGDRFVVYAEDSGGQLWGYSYYGNWSGWYTLLFNMRQWWGIGDLGETECNTVHLSFESDSSSNSGWWGAMVDDVYLYYGESVGAYQCSIIADPAEGPAPLTVAFRGVNDWYPTGYYWWFGDGGSSETQDPAHTFETQGTYWVSLMTYDSWNRCESALRVVVTQGTCTYSISPTSKSFDHQGGTGSVAVTASPSNCNWSASSNRSWITITSGSAGTGNGTVQYSVAANTSASSRSGQLTIAGKTFNISQEGAPSCSFSISPSSRSFTAGGGNGSISVTTTTGCSWTASESSAWLAITSGSSGSGSGNVNYSVGANGGSSSRTGTIQVAGKSHTVYQDGAPSCSYSISPPSRNFNASGGTGSISVTTASGCSWSVSESLSWLAITSGSSGSGSGNVNYSVGANGNANSRTGNIQVAGKTHTVHQDGAGVTVTDTYGVAGIAHANGAGGSVWRSTLAVTNRSGSTANLTLIYRYSGTSKTRSHTLQNGDIVEWVDVATSLFGVGSSSSGSVEVQSTRPVIVTARTYNEGADGTFGQYLPGVDDGNDLAHGEMGILAQVKKTSSFRTNIGFVNLGQSSVTVRTKMYSNTGSQLGNTVTTNISGNQWKQENDVFQKAGVSFCEVGYATVEVTTYGGSVWAYASVVDNGTGDPTTIPVSVQ